MKKLSEENAKKQADLEAQQKKQKDEAKSNNKKCYIYNDKNGKKEFN